MCFFKSVPNRFHLGFVLQTTHERLEKTHWCRKDAAKMLGISYKALLYKIRQFGLDTPRPARASGNKDVPGEGGGSTGSHAVPTALAPAGSHSDLAWHLP